MLSGENIIAHVAGSACWHSCRRKPRDKRAPTRAAGAARMTELREVIFAGKLTDEVEAMRISWIDRALAVIFTPER